MKTPNCLACNKCKPSEVLKHPKEVTAGASYRCFWTGTSFEDEAPCSVMIIFLSFPRIFVTQISPAVRSVRGFRGCERIAVVPSWYPPFHKLLSRHQIRDCRPSWVSSALDPWWSLCVRGQVATSFAANERTWLLTGVHFCDRQVEEWVEAPLKAKIKTKKKYHVINAWVLI